MDLLRTEVSLCWKCYISNTGIFGIEYATSAPFFSRVIDVRTVVAAQCTLIRDRFSKIVCFVYSFISITFFDILTVGSNVLLK